MLIDSEGHGELTLQIAPSEYVHVDMEDSYLEVRALVTDPATGHVVLEKSQVVMMGKFPVGTSAIRKCFLPFLVSSYFLSLFFSEKEPIVCPFILSLFSRFRAILRTC